MSAPKEFTRVAYLEPHLGRTKQILAKHPELRKLFGYTPSTALYIVGVVALQVLVGLLLIGQPWWVIGIASWTIGAIADHALWTLIHDATHNAVFKSSAANKWIQIVAGFQIVFPSSITFRNYHLFHHRHQGELDMDADLAIPFERWLAEKGPIGKALWFLFFPIWQPMRVSRLRTKAFDRWVVYNIIAEAIFIAIVTYFSGSWVPVAYMLASSIFSVGLHPVGARWIQEHYLIPGHEPQETYSYYGPLNTVAFNVGYHNEHHDFTMVPWSRLPAVKAAAPEFYDPLHSHKSWTGLWLRFIFDRKINLSSRIVRIRSAENSNVAQAVPAGMKTLAPGLVHVHRLSPDLVHQA